jgi:hypothetical protein
LVVVGQQIQAALTQFLHQSQARVEVMVVGRYQGALVVVQDQRQMELQEPEVLAQLIRVVMAAVV